MELQLEQLGVSILHEDIWGVDWSRQGPTFQLVEDLLYLMGYIVILLPAVLSP